MPSLPGFGDYASAPHLFDAYEADYPDQPICPDCGAGEVVFEEGDHESGPVYGCADCYERARVEREERLSRARRRGAFLRRRTVRRGRRRFREAYLLRGRRPSVANVQHKPAVVGRLRDGNPLYFPFHFEGETQEEVDRIAAIWERHGRVVKRYPQTTSRLPDDHPARPAPAAPRPRPDGDDGLPF